MTFRPNARWSVATIRRVRTLCSVLKISPRLRKKIVEGNQILPVATCAGSLAELMVIIEPFMNIAASL